MNCDALSMHGNAAADRIEQDVKCAIILAAGLSRRFGHGNKLLASWRGRPLVLYVIQAAQRSSLEHVVLVTGCDGDAVADLTRNMGFSHVHNADFASGMSSSLRAGLNAAPAGPILVLLGDMPLISASTINTLCAAWRSNAYALAPEFEGRLGNPVILSERARKDAEQLQGDYGARTLFKARKDIIRCAIRTRAVLQDVDVAADFGA